MGPREQEDHSRMPAAQTATLAPLRHQSSQAMLFQAARWCHRKLSACTLMSWRLALRRLLRAGAAGYQTGSAAVVPAGLWAVLRVAAALAEGTQMANSR